MKNDKIVRQIDDLGRVVIPKDMRRMIGVDCGDKIAFETDGNTIVISKPQKHCVFCNSRHELRVYADKYVCKECLKLLKAIEM